MQRKAFGDFAISVSSLTRVPPPPFSYGPTLSLVFQTLTVGNIPRKEPNKHNQNHDFWFFLIQEKSWNIVFATHLRDCCVPASGGEKQLKYTWAWMLSTLLDRFHFDSQALPDTWGNSPSFLAQSEAWSALCPSLRHMGENSNNTTDFTSIMWIVKWF